MSKLPQPFPEVLLLLFLISIPFNVISETIETERTVLLNLKEQLGNPPAIQLWNVSSSPCSWPGINCTDGSVTSVSLHHINITVKIPPSICKLKNLTFLDLAFNVIPGGFPTLLYNCSKLQHLDLSQNYFIGSIPGDIYQLSTLVYLDLSGNNFSGDIPPGIGGLRQLKELHLEYNEFNATFPEEIGNLSNLELLWMANNGFVRMIDYQRKRQGGDLATWKLTPFHRLDFTEEDILSRLTENNLIGSGGSGEVFKIAINESDGFVAVKRIWNNKKLDGKLEKQFIAEAEILGRIHHANIINLYGCISNENSKHLVYEYMENQSLDRWLHAKKKKSSSLGMNSVHHVVLYWPTRMQIAIGAAQGLCYMHHDCCPPIIHRDVKSSNILLDSEFKARIADFGLAKMLTRQGEPHTMSVLYTAEYAYTGRANEKIDVYSFGVVLLELVTGREAINGDEQMNLAGWARQYYPEGRPEVEIFDPEVYEPCHLEEMTSVYKLGLRCTSDSPSSRPSMKEVLHSLQHHDPLRSWRSIAPDALQHIIVVCMTL